ncbi:CoF synthetase [Paenibacillaceae bacterium]|nr:CoF synthetase [Paenibacillaceae bacterium]
MITANLLEEHYYKSPAASDASVYRTSGTGSGIRKSISYSDQDEEQYVAIKTALFGKLIAEDAIARAVADMGTGHAADTAIEIFRRLGLERESIPFDQPLAYHAERLAAFQPELLYTMPSILDQLATRVDDGLFQRLRKVILVGETASQAWQQRMAAKLELAPEAIIDTYGSIEIGTIASYDHERGCYVIADGLYAEGIGTEQLDERLEPLGEEESILVLTSFVRTYFPGIRYVTYDVVRGLRNEVVNGNVIQCFDCLVKRVGRELKHGEKISLYDIETVIYAHLEQADFRVQLIDNALHIRIQSKQLDPQTTQMIRKAVEEQIPEIGMMIRNKLIRGIEVEAVADGEELERGKVKTKKIYY